MKLLTKTLQFFILCLFATIADAQISWPENQLLPSFPPTAQVQDLIYLRGNVLALKEITWQAEDGSLAHATGRKETDGWLCQTGVDNPQSHMIFGPYSKEIARGRNIAEFRMKTDNTTAEDIPVVDIDVRNAQTGQELAKRTITRRQFNSAGVYQNFELSFEFNADNQPVEFRVYWYGGAYAKVDWIKVKTPAQEELYLFSTLKGLINEKQPRIFSYEGDQFAEGPYTWMQSLNLDWVEHQDNWELISKYRDEIEGIIVYDPAELNTVNLATMMAKEKKAIVVGPSLISRLTSAPYNLPILEDLRGKYTNKLQVYQEVFDDYWPTRDKRMLIGISPTFVKASVREYAVATGATVIWLNPGEPEENDLLVKFLASMPQDGNYLGWWPEEGLGITRASEYGIPTIPCDYATNLTVHGGMPRGINIKPAPPKPPLENKIYVAFILSDGDNLQFVEHLMRKLWANPDRGSVPIGWTISPSMVDAMPGALNYLYQTATDNDNLVSGPSGYGYIYPNFYPNSDKLRSFVRKTDEYNKKSGIRVTTVWNTITGGIDQDAGQVYEANSTTLLGLTGQNTGGGLSIYNSSLPGMALSCNYCTNTQAMKNHINTASQGWNGNEPRFIIIQSQPWQDVKPSNFKDVANSLNNNYKVVRPDHLFQLLREANGLEVNPGGDLINPTKGFVTAYKHCRSDSYSAGFDVGDYSAQDLTNVKIDDKQISSIDIREGYKAILYQENNFGGISSEFLASVSCFNPDWNDQTSSLKVRPNGEPNLTGTYFIQNKASELYVDIKGGVGSTENGVEVIQAPFYGTDNQKFELEDRGDGSYSVIAKHSGRALDVIGISKSAGARLQQYDYLNGANQRFILVPAGDNYYKMIAEHTGMVAQVSSDKIDEQLRQWHNHNGDNALWSLIDVDLLSIGNHSTSSDIAIYPNPAKNSLNVYTNEIVEHVEISDLNGKIILTSNLTTIPLNRISAGNYVVKIITVNHARTYHFVKE